MTESLKGLDITAVEKKVAEVMELLAGKEEPTVDPFELGELAALIGVRKFPPRVKCATLSWHTLEAALNKEDQISTE